MTTSATSGPDDELRALLARVRQVELRARRAVDAHATGAWHSRFKGRGMAFDESRTYVPGDDPRHVDWNVTARTGDLYVKQFVEERELTLLVAVDLSGSLRFGSAAREKRALAAEVAALLAFAALRNDDKVGLLLFTDRTERLIRPRKGRGHVLRLVREILACRPEGRGTDLGAALDTVGHLTRQRAIIALVSDLQEAGNDATVPLFGADDPASLGALERPLKVLSKRHELMLFEVEDPLERALPDVGLVRVEDPETGAEAWIDTSSTETRAIFAERIDRERAALAARLLRLGVEHLTLGTDQDSSAALVRFLQRRARRAA